MREVGPDAVWSGDFDEIVDVRAPVEYGEDHVPGAVNLPVLDDLDRAEVGTLYREQGGFTARRLGARLVSRAIETHLAGHFSGKPASYRPLVYCWRGGMRSAGLAWVLGQIGWPVTVLKGGYKAYRRLVLEGLDEFGRPDAMRFVVIGGYTGSGKTRLLAHLASRGAQVLDLEGLARHRGSILGDLPGEPQPSQKYFENRVFQVLRCFDREQPVFLESESHRIGNCYVPGMLWPRFREAELVVLDAPIEARRDYLVAEYSDLRRGASEVLAAKLRVLERRHGADRVDEWLEHADRGRWFELAESLLAEHYDPSYRRSRRQIYGETRAEFELSAIGDGVLDGVAARILAWASKEAPVGP